MFLLRCSKWIQYHSGRFRTLPAEFQFFFPYEKNAFSVVYFWSKSPYYRQFAWIFIKIQYFVFPPVALIMASIMFGIRSIGFWVSPIGLVFQTWLSAFFHMCMVRLWPAFFSRLSTLVQVQIHLQIQFLRACNHDFAEGNHFLHGLTVLIKSKIMKQKDFTQGFFPPPGYICTPCSFMNTTIALHFRTYLFVMWKCCILLM